MPAFTGTTREKTMTDTVKVLIGDKMDPKAATIFRERGIEVDEKPGLAADELQAIIGGYDGVAVRSSTKINAAAMDAALPRLKVIGRAGIGVDTIDVPAASARGIVVMNTPFGNSITTAEHAIAMLFALAREIPQADQSTQSGKWEKNRFMGVELDVFVQEPAKDNPLFGTPGLICTPHLGASTTEAQVNVAIQIAEQMSDYLLLGGITNAVNVPSLSAEEAPRLRPYMGLAEKLGRLVGQIAGHEIRSVDVEVEGHAAELNLKPITGAVLAGVMRTWSDTVNMVNAPYLAKERGIAVREIRDEGEGDYHTLVAVTVGTEHGPRRVEGTLFGNRAPRLVNIFGVPIEAELTGQMIYIVNTDAPGFIGALGTKLGENRINIATFNLGRRKDAGEAIALVAVDDPITPDVVQQLKALPGVREVVPLSF